MLKHINFDKELTSFIKKRARQYKKTESAYIRELVWFDYQAFCSEKSTWLADQISKQFPEKTIEEKMSLLRGIRKF